MDLSSGTVKVVGRREGKGGDVLLSTDGTEEILA